jgi:ABC-type amino acid transport substrate-binding protein
LHLPLFILAKTKSKIHIVLKEKIMKGLFLRILPVLMIVSMLLGACATPIQVVPVVVAPASATPIGPQPSSTLTPVVTPAASATSAPLQSDDVWDRIVANNKIVVGTAWDYPPFASVDPNFQVVGFDIALIQEIGRRLNIPVDIQNFTFEGLPGALQLNQIDLAVAAISITPERASQMAFSPVYYVNQTALLARKDSQVNITDFNQLVGLRVGVQRGTTYEAMVQNLVDAGLMRADKLLRYMQADEAVRDLVENRVDLVVFGQATASYYSSEPGLEVVGKGFNQQDLAVGMRLGTPRLQAEIDRVMKAMLIDGTILGLIQQYIQSDVTGVLPTPIPTNQPTATTVPPVPTLVPPACLDGMKFIADVTYDDNDMKNPPFIKPGEGFVKSWRVQNTGTCTWTPSYQLVYAYGNIAGAQMNGQPLNIPGNVTPGQMIDLKLTLIAPTKPLTYQGFWQMQNAAGGRFGQVIWVGITTLSDLDNPVATGQPAGNYCTVTLTAPKNSITVRSNFDTIWTVKNTSTDNWASDSVDYKFISGTAMHLKAVYDFTQTIKAGASGEIIVDMVGPTTPGIYNTKWAIVSGDRTLCIMTVSVTVVAK